MTDAQTAAIAAHVQAIEANIANKVQLHPDDEIFYRDYLLTTWQAKKAALEIAKEEEMIWRKKSVDFAFDPEKKSGTERIDLGNGYQAKTVKKITYGFVKDAEGKLDKQKIDNALLSIESTGPAGVLIADRLVKWTPTLSLTEYNQITPEFKKIIDEVIVVDEGAPTLEIIEPKAKK